MDVKLLAQTLDAIVVESPAPDDDNLQHLCADAGYIGKDALAVIWVRNYEPHIRPRNKEAEQKRTEASFKARRWVVERSHSWFNGYRKILVSFEKTEASFVALLYLASALASWRQTPTICGYALTVWQLSADEPRRP
ncbi:MAG: transposase [Terracidiphilus sp.]|jgi:transposase